MIDIPNWLPLFFGPAFGVVVLIVIGVVLARDRWKERHGPKQMHPGE